MDPVTIGLVLAGVSAIVGIVAWLFPRAPVSSSLALPPPVPSGSIPETVIVSLSFGLLTYPDPPYTSEQKMFVNATNADPKLRKLDGYGLQVVETKQSIVSPISESMPALPCLLGETDSFRAWMSLKYVGVALVEHGVKGKVHLRGFVTDTYGGKHFSDPPYECDPEDWANRKL
jgi:hypothetical protein